MKTEKCSFVIGRIPGTIDTVNQAVSTIELGSGKYVH